MKPENNNSNEVDVERVGKILIDSKAELATRFRALFTLKSVANADAISWISKTLLNDSSALLKHECAYCLGQMQNPTANDVLKIVLANKDEHAMVRHEAGEALAAIGSVESLDILKQYSYDEVIEVAQTCQLGVQKIQMEQTRGVMNEQNVKYSSVDPTPAFQEPGDDSQVARARECLIGNSSHLFEKYQALFTLRNIGTEQCVKILGDALIKYQNDDKNNLLKHEIAYVFGQMQHPASVPYLKRVLENVTENEMVRHEAAEALGSVANDEASLILEKFKHDKVQVVRESIEIALDMNEYEKSNEQFNFIE